MRDLNRFLRERRFGETERTPFGIDDAAAREKTQRGLACNVDGAPRPVLAAFDQQRVFRTRGVAEGGVVAHAPAGRVPGIAHRQCRITDFSGEAAPLGQRAGEH